MCARGLIISPRLPRSGTSANTTSDTDGGRGQGDGRRGGWGTTVLIGAVGRHGARPPRTLSTHPSKPSCSHTRPLLPRHAAQTKERTANWSRGRRRRPTWFVGVRCPLSPPGGRCAGPGTHRHCAQPPHRGTGGRPHPSKEEESVFSFSRICHTLSRGRVCWAASFFTLTVPPSDTTSFPQCRPPWWQAGARASRPHAAHPTPRRPRRRRWTRLRPSSRGTTALRTWPAVASPRRRGGECVDGEGEAGNTQAYGGWAVFFGRPSQRGLPSLTTTQTWSPVVT